MKLKNEKGLVLVLAESEQADPLTQTAVMCQPPPPFFLLRVNTKTFIQSRAFVDCVHNTPGVGRTISKGTVVVFTLIWALHVCIQTPAQ